MVFSYLLSALDVGEAIGEDHIECVIQLTTSEIPMGIRKLASTLFLAIVVVSQHQLVFADDAKSDDPLFIKSLTPRPLTSLIELKKKGSQLSIENTEFFATESYTVVMGGDCNHVSANSEALFITSEYVFGLAHPARGFLEIEDLFRKETVIESQNRLDVASKTKTLTGGINYGQRPYNKCRLVRVNGARLIDGNWVNESTYIRPQDIRKIYRATSLQEAIDIYPKAIDAIKNALDMVAASEQATNDFRSNLKVGDGTNCGMVVEMKPPIALIQMPNNSQKWIRLDELDTRGKTCRTF